MCQLSLAADSTSIAYSYSGTRSPRGRFSGSSGVADRTASPPKADAKGSPGLAPARASERPWACTPSGDIVDPLRSVGRWKSDRRIPDRDDDDDGADGGTLAADDDADSDEDADAGAGAGAAEEDASAEEDEEDEDAWATSGKVDGSRSVWAVGKVVVLVDTSDKALAEGWRSGASATLALAVTASLAAERRCVGELSGSVRETQEIRRKADTGALGTLADPARPLGSGDTAATGEARASSPPDRRSSPTCSPLGVREMEVGATDEASGACEDEDEDDRGEMDCEAGSDAAISTPLVPLLLLPSSSSPARKSVRRGPKPSTEEARLSARELADASAPPSASTSFPIERAGPFKLGSTSTAASITSSDRDDDSLVIAAEAETGLGAEVVVVCARLFGRPLARSGTQDSTGVSRTIGARKRPLVAVFAGGERKRAVVASAADCDVASCVRDEIAGGSATEG